jgi:hypothetical protein
MLKSLREGSKFFFTRWVIGSKSCGAWWKARIVVRLGVVVMVSAHLVYLHDFMLLSFARCNS